MADNTELDSGSGGDTIATDDIGGVKYPRSKIVIGADGTNDGDVSATNPLPIKGTGTAGTANAGVVTVQGIASMTAVAISAASLPLPSGAATEAKQDTEINNLAAIKTAVEIIDNAISGNEMQVDLVGLGGAATETTLATIAGYLDTEVSALVTAVQILDNVVSGNEAQVDVVAALPEGTNSIGQVTANAGTNLNTSLLALESGGNLAGVATSLAVIDDWDESDRCKVTLPTTDRASSHYRNVDANAEAAIKASAGTLYWIQAINLTAAIAYLHLYDDTTGNVNPGTTVPNYTFPIPTAGSTNGAGFNFAFGGRGQAFANGITLVVTTTIDGSAGDPGTNGVMVNAGYA